MFTELLLCLKLVLYMNQCLVSILFFICFLDYILCVKQRGFNKLLSIVLIELLTF